MPPAWPCGPLGPFCEGSGTLRIEGEFRMLPESKEPACTGGGLAGGVLSCDNGVDVDAVVTPGAGESPGLCGADSAAAVEAALVVWKSL